MVAAALHHELEASLLTRVIDPEQGGWPPEAARAVLKLTLPIDDRQRMNSLAEKAAAGTLTRDEELQIESYRHVCRLIDLLKARASASLHQASAS